VCIVEELFDMALRKLDRFTFADLPDEASPYMIKNFIISNNYVKFKNISFDHPFSFEGIVFIICLKGSGKVKISFKEFQTEEDSVITILPNQVVERMDHTEDFFIEMLAFSPDFLSDLPFPRDFDIIRKISQNPVLKIQKDDIQNLLRYHSFIIDTFNRKNHLFFEQVIKGHLYSLLLEIFVLYVETNTEAKKVTTRSEEITEQFLILLKDHFKEGRTASYYADKMFITPKYLSSTLKKVTGRSINSWIEGAITIGAKIMLKSTNLTVLQISEELNFPNPSYFGRFFKKNTGMTPRDYRES